MLHASPPGLWDWVVVIRNSTGTALLAAEKRLYASWDS